MMFNQTKILFIFLFLTLLFSGELCAYFDGDFEIQNHFLPNKENFYDWKAYQHPISWRYKWYLSKNAMKGTTGSLSQEQFYNQHAIKLQADVTDYFSVLYTQEQEELYKSKPLYQEIEARLGKRYYLSVIGFPYYDKRYDNLGLAASYGERYSFKHIRLAFLKQYAQYDKRNVTDDRHQVSTHYSKTPELYRLNTQYVFFNQLYLIMDLQQELEATLTDYSSQLKKSYKGHRYNVTLDWSPYSTWLVGASLQLREEERHHLPLPGTDGSAIDQEIGVQQYDFYVGLQLKGNEISFGYLDSAFKNSTLAEDPALAYHMHLYSKQAYLKWKNQIFRLQKTV